MSDDLGRFASSLRRVASSATRPARARRCGAACTRLALSIAVSVATATLWLTVPADAQQATGTEATDGSAAGGPLVPLTIPQLPGGITLDGVVDEPAWGQIQPLPMTMFSPVFGGPLSEATEIRIGHDDRYLYVSGRMYDSEPEQIRTNTLYRDQYSGDDLIAVVIDSYDDYETAVWFVVNPAGVRSDRTVSNDAEFNGGMPMNADWNSHWDVATSQNDEGWFAEMRIPFSTLGFQASGGQVTMGLIAYRFIARKNERHLFPAIDPEYGGLAFAKPSMARRIVLDDVRQSTPVYVTPYSLGGVNHTPALSTGTAGPRWETDADATAEAGFDIKLSPTSNTALDLTVNTDFAQVEADNQQINLTRFALFFPEKRQFFQERASTFDFRTGGFTDRLFHSRRIGLSQAKIVRIYGGARAVGRVGGLDFGFLNMQTAASEGRSAENMGVLRLQQQVFNPYSSVGGMLTSRLGSNGDDNIAYGLDASVRVVGDEYATVKWAQTFDEAVEEGGTLASGLIQARWERRIDGGLSYSGEYRRVGEDFLPRLGFQLRKDFSYYAGNVQYKRFLSAESRLRSVSVSGRSNHYYRNVDGSAESRVVTPELEFEFKGGAQLRLSGNSNFESVADSFSISDVFIRPGEYWFHDGQARLELPRSGLFRGDFTATAGTFYDGTRLGLAVNPSVSASKHLEFGGGYEVNRLEFSERDAATTAHLVRAQIDVALDTRLSISTLGQYNTVDDLTSFNVRFRYHFSEGTDLWVVYNEGLNTVRSNGLDPRLPLSAGRNITIKYSHALIF